MDLKSAWKKAKHLHCILGENATPYVLGILLYVSQHILMGGLAGLYGIPTLSLSYYTLPVCLLNVLWIFIIMTGILYTCCAFQYPTWKLWEMSI